MMMVRRANKKGSLSRPSIPRPLSPLPAHAFSTTILLPHFARAQTREFCPCAYVERAERAFSFRSFLRHFDVWLLTRRVEFSSCRALVRLAFIPDHTSQSRGWVDTTRAILGCTKIHSPCFSSISEPSNMSLFLIWVNRISYKTCRPVSTLSHPANGHAESNELPPWPSLPNSVNKTHEAYQSCNAY